MTANLPSNIDSRPVTVVGAGTLGRRIALMFATQGGQVRIFDKAPDRFGEPPHGPHAVT